MKKCLVCEELLVARRPSYWQACSACGFLASTLQPEINSHQESIDEELRQAALRSLRERNYRTILGRLKQANLDAPTTSATLMDVGCAHGWFLEAARQAGYRVIGIEPDTEIARQAIERGLEVRIGYFPEACPADIKLDVITFNDVLEHLNDLPGVLAACRASLAPAGLLAISLPSSRGVLFRTARLMAQLGMNGPLDRLWQRGFPSPHLSYFHPENLARFVRKHGFQEVHRQTLPSLIHTGLWQRLRYDRRARLGVSMVQYALLTCAMPCLRILPSDISFQIFRASV